MTSELLPPPASPAPRRFGRVLLVLCSVLLATLGWGWRSFSRLAGNATPPLAVQSPTEQPAERDGGPGASSAPPTPAVAPAPVTDTPAPSPEAPVAQNQKTTLSDDHLKTHILGSWTDNYRGKRHLTVRADGTATMVSEPEGLGAKLVAPRLQFEIAWTLQDGVLDFETTGGEPEGKVRMVLRLYGSKRAHDVLVLSADEMILLDEDGETRYTWTRVAEEEPPGERGT